MMYKDLRINDYFKINGNIVKISRVAKSVKYKYNNHSYVCQKLSDLNPIPLKREIIDTTQKNNMYVVEMNNSVKITREFFGNVNGYGYKDNITISLLFDDTDFAFLEIYSKIGGLNISIKYVHELQHFLSDFNLEDKIKFKL